MEESIFGGDFDPSTFGLAFMMQILFRREIANSAMSISGEIAEPAPLPRPEEAKLSPRPPEVSRLRRAALLAASFLVGGTVVWFGARAFTRTGAVASTPGNLPVSAMPPAPIPAPANPPAPALPVSSISSPATPVTPGPEKPFQPLSHQTSPSSVFPVAAIRVPVPPKGQPVRLRVFVDEQGRVRQVHVISGAAGGSERERAAYAAAMEKKFAPAQLGGQTTRTWEEITVIVP